MGNKVPRIGKTKVPKIGVLMLGLDKSGKTTLLYKVKNGTIIDTTTTIGFTYEIVEWNKLSFNIWECGGHENCRVLWRHFYEAAHAIIFVIDSTDRERLGFMSQRKSKLLINGYMHKFQPDVPSELYSVVYDYYVETSDKTAKAVLYHLLREQYLQHCKIWLILANKQDCSNAMGIDEIESVLELDNVIKRDDNNKREIHIQSCSVIEDLGLNEAMDWLKNALKRNDTSTKRTPSGFLGNSYN